MTTTTVDRTARRLRVPVGFPGLLRSEAVLMRRNPALILWVGLLPVIASVVLGAVARHPSSDLEGQSWFGLYQPILVMFSVVLISVQILPDVLTRYRELGILKRLRTTPAAPAALLAAQVAITFVIGTAVMVLMVLVPTIVGAPLPRNLVGFVVAYVFSALCMLSIGLVLASVVRSNKIASAIGTVLFLALQFFAGLWIPRQTMPTWLRDVSDATPSGSAVGALTEAVHGSWPELAHLGVMLGWTVVLTAIAVRIFRWE